MKLYNGMTWRELLNGCVREYKVSHPNSGASDWEIMESLMEHLVDSGLVAKRRDGKYTVPPFIGRVQ